MSKIFSYLHSNEDSSILAVYRIFFGLLMFVSLLRFWLKGWIDELYLLPSYHFSYLGFEWIEPLGNNTYFLFLICSISSICILLGLKYRLSIIIFFLSFTYIELMDKTTYLNHYYFISILSFLLIFIPANASFSIDNIISKRTYTNVPRWTVDSIKLLISIVYIYAAIAKLNSDWIVDAMPLKIWLSSNYDLPILGYLFQQEWVHYFMSWAGLLYDFSIPFLLYYSRTRLFGFFLVIIFHLLTKVLFPIGMFPYIMIFSSLIFFSANFHRIVINNFKAFLNRIIDLKKDIKTIDFYIIKYSKSTLIIVSLFFILQLLIPFRYLLYPGELLWHEQGYRFSWRVMLVEKTGIANFKIVNPVDSTYFYVDNTKFLTPLQEKQMSFQSDMILEYAHWLGDFYSKYDNDKVQVFVDSYVSLNGRKSQRYVSNNIDLYSIKRSLKNKEWIIPLRDEIKGI